MSKPFIPEGFFQGGANLTGDTPVDLEALLNALGIRFNDDTATLQVAAFSQAARPDPSSVPVGTVIFNTDDNAPNWSDGTVWRNSAGVTT